MVERGKGFGRHVELESVVLDCEYCFATYSSFNVKRPQVKQLMTTPANLCNLTLHQQKNDPNAIK